MALYLAIAHTGKTLQLGVQPSQRVDAVQQALVTFTGVPVAEQILMLAGTKLEPSRPLSAYKLPVEDAAAAADESVYLYCKSHLRPGAALPPLDTLPAIVPQVPLPLTSAAVAAAVAPHPLAKAPQTTVQDLPKHELAFSHHVATATAYWEASSARLQRCRQLLSEQEVQSRAADAATVNVEAHYRWITAAMTSFMQRYQQQCAQHAQLLTSFSEDQALLDTIRLPPALQVGQLRTLADLPAASRAREVAANCRKYLAQFADKVSQLDPLYESLKLDMEALIMQAPSVDLDSLGMQLLAAEEWQQEQAAIMQVLSKDLATLQQLIEQLVRRSAGAGGLAVATPTRQLQSQSAEATPSHPAGTGSVRAAGSGVEEASASEGAVAAAATRGIAVAGQSMAQLLDACQAVPAMASAHESQQLPRMAALDAGMAVLEEKCVTAKQQMTADVLAMLQRISLQQSKIRDMRARLSGFDALLQRQSQMFAELQPLGRLSAAYRATLAECERRRAWHQLKTAQAAEFVDRLEAQYQREASKRQGFLQQVGRYLPQELLSAAGLADGEDSLPLPSMSVPPAPHNLLPVSLQELMQIPQPPTSVTLTMAAISQLLHPTHGAGTTNGEPETAQGGEEGGQGAGEAGVGPATSFAPPLPDPTSMHRLEMENARLRAELADIVAQNSLALLYPTAPQQGVPGGMLVSMEGGTQALAHTISGTGSQLPGHVHHPTHAHSSSDGAGLTGRGVDVSAGSTTPRNSHAGQQGPSSGGVTSTNPQAVGSQQLAGGPSSTSASPALGRSSSGSNWRRQPSGGLSTAMSMNVVSGSPGAQAMHSARSFGHAYNLSGQPSAGSSPSARPPLSTPVGSFGGSATLLASRSPQVSNTGTPAGIAPNSRNSSATHLPTATSLPTQLLLQPQPSVGSSTVLAVPDTPGRAAQGTPVTHGTSSRMLQPHPSVGNTSLQQSGRAISNMASNLLAAPSAAGTDPSSAESQAVTALKQAVSMREQYCTALQFEIRALSDQVGTYAERIQQLENLLASGQQQGQQNASQSDALHSGQGSMHTGHELPGRVHTHHGNLQPHAEPDMSLHDGSVAHSSVSLQQASKLPQPDSEDPLMCSDSSLFEPHGPISPGAPVTSSLAAEETPTDAVQHPFRMDPARRATTAPASPQASQVVATDGGTPAVRVGSDSAANPASNPRPASHGGWASPSQLPLNSGLSTGHNTLGPIALAALGSSRTHTPEPSIDSTGGQPAGFMQHHAAAAIAVGQVAQQVAAAGPLPLLLRDSHGLGPAPAGMQPVELWHMGPFEAMPDVWGTHPLFKGRCGMEVASGAVAVSSDRSSVNAVQGSTQQAGASAAAPVQTAGSEVQNTTAGFENSGGSATQGEMQSASAPRADPSNSSAAQQHVPSVTVKSADAAGMGEVQAGGSAPSAPPRQGKAQVDTTPLHEEATIAPVHEQAVSAATHAQAAQAPPHEEQAAQAEAAIPPRLSHTGDMHGAVTHAADAPASDSHVADRHASSPQASREDEDEPVPDIDEVFTSAAAGPMAILPAGPGSPHDSSFGGNETRTWLAAGSGLGASMLFSGEQANTHEVAGASDQQTGSQGIEGAVGGTGVGSSSSDLQGSMYASAIASDS